jgi:hypothetical protein
MNGHGIIARIIIKPIVKKMARLLNFALLVAARFAFE